MRRALMIAYSFPPTGGPGVQRSLKFAKYLREYGWEPVVLTRDIAGMELKDTSLEKDIPEGIKIVRTPACGLTEVKGILSLPAKFIARKLLMPDSERLWAEFAKKPALEILKRDGIEVLYTTSVPYSSHLVGLYLKKKYPSLPWVADFRDEWTNNPYLLDNPHNYFRMHLERSWEKKVLAGANKLIANTPVMLNNFLQLNRELELEGKFEVIPNGYDKSDFDEYKDDRPQNDKFTITYTGSFYGRRKPDTFFKAIHSLIRDKRLDAGLVRVKLIGSFKMPYITELIKDFNLGGIIEVFPYMEHDECVKQMLSSDALLLIEGGGPGSEAFYTGKLFEYIFAGRPIIAAIPVNGAAAQVIRETNTGYVTDNSDVKGLGYTVEHLFSLWEQGEWTYNPNYIEIAKYDRRALTNKLAEIFNNCKTQKVNPDQL